MMEAILQQFVQGCNELPSVITMKCLLKKEMLPEGVMPAWLTKCVNWAIKE